MDRLKDSQAMPLKHIWPIEGITGIEESSNEGAAGSSEIRGIKGSWAALRAKLDPKQLSEFESRMNRQWAIETGIIENLYDIDRGITKNLIAKGFSPENLGETQNPSTLDFLKVHQEVIERCYEDVKEDTPITEHYIKSIHAQLMLHQDTVSAVDTCGRQVERPAIKGAYKQQKNYPTRDGTEYAYCPPEHTKSQIEKLLKLYSTYTREKQVPIHLLAAWFHHRFTQIHPFQDGNGRVARAITSLILIKAYLFPFLVLSKDKDVYIDALESADNGELAPFADIILQAQRQQYQDACEMADPILESDKNLGVAFTTLTKTATELAENKTLKFEDVFNLAQLIEKRLQDKLKAVGDDIKESLQPLQQLDGYREGGIGIQVVVSEAEINDHYYSHDIFKNAKKESGLAYYANFAPYRSWVALYLTISGRLRTKLVFALHGIGYHFSGSLICAPFLLVQTGEREGVGRTVVPVTDQGFIFYSGEKASEVTPRLEKWLDHVLSTAIYQVNQYLREGRG